jgi:hypothetical protein
MQSLSSSGDIAHSARVHLSVLDEFISVVQKKLDETANPFTHDSLSDLLADLVEQRDDYRAFTTPVAVPA